MRCGALCVLLDADEHRLKDLELILAHSLEDMIVPIGDDGAKCGHKLVHFFSRVDKQTALVLGFRDADDVGILLELGEGARDGALVEADVLRDLLLRAAGIANDRPDQRPMGGGEVLLYVLK